MHRHAFLYVTLITLLSSSCVNRIFLDVRPGSCINPPHGHCMEEGQDSRWLDVRVYQLKKSIDPCKLDLEEFKQGQEIATLKADLTDKDRLDAVMLKFPVERNDPKRLPAWEILKETNALLIVALGRGRGKNSVRLVPVDEISGSATLYFSEYDVCIGDSCERRVQEQCP